MVSSKCRTVQKERRKFKQIGPRELFVKKSKRRWKGQWKFSARCAVWRCERAQRRRQQCGGFGGRSEWVALLTTAAVWLLKGWDVTRGRCDTPLVPPEGSRWLAELQSGSSCSDVSPDRPALHPSSPFSLFLCWLFFSLPITLPASSFPLFHPSHYLLAFFFFFLILQHSLSGLHIWHYCLRAGKLTGGQLFFFSSIVVTFIPTNAPFEYIQNAWIKWY